MVDDDPCEQDYNDENEEEKDVGDDDHLNI